ncbi:MAG: hypothetical protein FWG71_01155 [Synergistaceae bacterium]|nr:hypothetical protein [Synergistaceae bacterium]
MLGEMEEKLSQIKSCPEPCDDGMVVISASSGQARKMPCPLIASNCPYGEWMEHGLDRCVTGVMSDIGVPRRHLENFAEAFQAEALTGIDKWPARGFLIFTGDTGSGKSFGAALAVRKYLKSLVANRFDRRTWEIAEKAGNSVVWCAAMDINHDRETAELAKHGQLAVIDDLGGEADIPAVQTVLRGIILRRYDMKLPTVITTTLTMLDIDLRYGGRVADRLTEDVGKGGMIIECGDVSIRNLVTGGRELD